ncbi:hypothetical protein JW887_03995 [Candidatus Dojkabacteria bacterium]|nr:hypothetical protein [Candidatus Dojkabacteria bacterium]
MVNIYEEEKKPAPMGLVVVGYLSALFFPILGFVLGIVCCLKERPKHGVLIILLNIVAAIVGYCVITALEA